MCTLSFFLSLALRLLGRFRLTITSASFSFCGTRSVSLMVTSFPFSLSTGIKVLLETR